MSPQQTATLHPEALAEHEAAEREHGPNLFAAVNERELARARQRPMVRVVLKIKQPGERPVLIKDGYIWFANGEALVTPERAKDCIDSGLATAPDGIPL